MFIIFLSTNIRTNIEAKEAFADNFVLFKTRKNVVHTFLIAKTKPLPYDA